MLAMSTNMLKLVHPEPKSSSDAVAMAPAIRLDGLLALMVTDLEGFTALVEQLGDVKAQASIQEYNRILRACISRRQGQEVAHTGDGIIAAFRSVVAAIGCAYDLQLALAEHSRKRSTALRARVGIHAGEPLPEEERLFGQCINTAVRVCGEAAPGRVLVTEVVEQLARGRVSFGAGKSHRLKGLSRAVTLFPLDHAPTR